MADGNAAYPKPSRRSKVEPFHAMDVLAKATRMRNAGVDVAMLCVGQPSAPAPKAALVAARLAVDDGRIGYSDALGRRELRERLARHYAEIYGVAVSADRIAITTGSSAGFQLAFLACFDIGARVAIAAPGYPAYRNILGALGLEVVEIETHAADGHALTPAMLDAAGPLDGLLVASPANPTGTMLKPDDLAALVRHCDAHGIRFISDEIYHGLVYPEAGAPEQATALAYGDETIVINSFSKYYCMTGWRIGWMVLPEALVRPVERLAQSLYICAPDLSQRAAVAALDESREMERHREGYLANRAMLTDALPALGMVDIAPMDGAFYAYADVSKLTDDSDVLARRLLEEAHVAVTPGRDFDPLRGKMAMRLSYAGVADELSAALDRMRKVLG
ncbi:aminotransferase class I/II-fold pyridoxal phosphate-dependent enzyme [Rhizobiaceae bacterium]|nr:aminotransferase class I/II-fold pyridoxal phosphate-dependent enzyme [Rhizobiaceae bacterium]